MSAHEAYDRMILVLEEMEEHCPEFSQGWFYALKLRNAVEGRE